MCCIVEFIGLLAPVAFVFALSALAQTAELKKKMALLELRIDALLKSQNRDDSPGASDESHGA